MVQQEDSTMKIARDKNGFLTDKQSEIMYNNLPIVLRTDNSDWELITKNNWLDWTAELEKAEYTQWGKVKIEA